MFHRHEKRETPGRASSIEWKDDETALRLIAATFGSHVTPVAQIFVHQAPLDRWGRVQLDRSTRPHSLVCRAICLHLEYSGTALSVATNIDHQTCLRAPASQHYALSEVLDSVDRLAAAAYERAYVLPVDAPRQHAITLGDLDFSVYTKPLY
jgi:hypothetical protein